MRDDQGHVVVDTIRSWIGHQADGSTEVIYPPTRQFLYFDPQTGLELGDHSRFFRDSYRSTAMHGLTNFDDAATVTFSQAIGANDPLRTGIYSKTLTFTLSTTNA